MSEHFTSTPSTSYPSLLTDLFDQLPYGVIVYEAVRDDERFVLDYRTVYYNAALLTISTHSKEQLEHQLLFQRSPLSRTDTEQMRRIVDERESFAYQYLDPVLNRWFSVENQPFNDGFFTIFHDIDEFKRSQVALEEKTHELQKNVEHISRQNDLLTCVLDVSPTSITIERPIRDEQGSINDFQAVFTNPASLALGGHSKEDVLSKPISQLNPQCKQSDLFINYRNVVESGRPFRVEFFHPPLSKHLEVAVTPLDAEHIVVLFNDVTAARQNALELQQRNELLDGILRTSESSIVVYQAVHDDIGDLIDFRLALVNEASLRAAGTTHDAIIDKLITEVYPDTKTNGLWHQYITVYKTGETFRGNHYYPAIDKWFDVTVSKLGDKLVATLIDITLAQLAAQKLEEQANLFDGVLKTMGNGLAVLEAIRDETGTIVDLTYVEVSQTILNSTGFAKEEIIGNTILNLFPGVKATAYWAAYLATFATGDPQHFEVYYNYDGYDNYTDNWVTRLDENRVISIYSDITSQKQAELQAKQQAALLQTVLDSCQIPIVFFEAIRNEKGGIIDFRYVLQNEANARVVGHSVGETTTKTMLEVLPSLKELGVFDRYVQTVETGQPQHFEQHFNGDTMKGWFDMSIMRQDDGLVVTANDQTLLRQMLQRTEQLVTELKQSNLNLEQFAYVASHDLQEPLRKIQSFSNLVLDQYSDAIPDDGVDMLRRMQSAAKRMSVLIRDLLTYSRLSTQSEPFEPVSLSSTLATILNDLELTIDEKKAQINIGDSNGARLPIIKGNPLQLRQLFQNLLSNALKFSRPDTTPTVSIQIRSVEAGNVPVNVLNRTNKSWLAIDVVDNGIGFDEQYQERIFQLFERLHGRSEYAGTGIGLTICRKVAENHGGAITAHSRPNEGATFTVYLPVS
ncbi:ATP-binding protein [Spirosoma soli]|uniref:histidine kinase n=1 Tax=Spirosoma soli TaxID=1770529 RepID=A0ABW5M8F0_9BACT